MISCVQYAFFGSTSCRDCKSSYELQLDLELVVEDVEEEVELTDCRVRDLYLLISSTTLLFSFILYRLSDESFSTTWKALHRHTVR